MDKATKIILLIAGSAAVLVALVNGLQNQWGEGAYFWAQAATMFILADRVPGK